MGSKPNFKITVDRDAPISFVRNTVAPTPQERAEYAARGLDLVQSGGWYDIQCNVCGEMLETGLLDGLAGDTTYRHLAQKHPQTLDARLVEQFSC